MRSLQIRELPTPIYDWLGQRAASEHRSLTQQAIAELQSAMRPAGQRSTALPRLQALARLRAAPGRAPLASADQVEEWQRQDRER